MLLHHFKSALRALAANSLLSAISFLGLSIGIIGAILMSLIAHNALGFNGFLPDHSRTYLGVSELGGPGMPPQPDELTIGLATPLIRANVPDVEAMARLAPQDDVELQVGSTRVRATIYWGDPEILSVLRFPAVAGDPSTALTEPDGLVMTASAARQWFGTSDALGRTMQVNSEPMIVRAVLRDQPPAQTDLEHGIIASGLNSRSVLAGLAADPDSFAIDSRTYLRLREGATKEDVERAMQPRVDTLVPLPIRGHYAMNLVRIDRIALDPGLSPGAQDRLTMGGLIVLLVLFIATANFVNLSLAVSGRRQREIGVRKANGASRAQIAALFLGETIVLVLIATLIALAASEWLIGPVNGFLDTDISAQTLHSPGFLLAILLGAVALGFIAGAYPAFVMARLRPAEIIKPGHSRRTQRGRLQTVLVGGQFAILIGLIIVTAVIHQQRIFAATDALRLDVDNVVMVRASCPTGFVVEVGRLPGVEGVSCSGSELLSGEAFAFLDINGRRVSAQYIAALPSTFGLFGVRPIAGRLDRIPPEGEQRISRVTINETAVSRFGFASPGDAVGRTFIVLPPQGSAPLEVTIVAVVPDFALTSVVEAIKPTVYFHTPELYPGRGLVSIKLDDTDIPPTVSAIDRTWQETGQPGVIDRTFVSAYLEELYRSLNRNTAIFAGFSALAILLACLGLIGLSVAAADRRIKEIGVRKAMGASTRQILQLLLWQFSRPVLIANIVAWPIAWWAMRRWLDGFAYHVPLNLWLFPAAGLLVLALGILTVGAQSFLAASQRPIKALRYE